MWLDNEGTCFASSLMREHYPPSPPYVSITINPRSPMNESVPNFYSRHSLHVEIYDTQTEQTWGEPKNDTAFYLEEAKASGGPVLELGCGTGRLAIPLLKTGLEVHGLDASAAMLEVAKHKRSQLSPEIAKRLHLHLGDMAKFKLEQ